MTKKTILFCIAILIIIFFFLIPQLVFIADLVAPWNFLSNNNREALKNSIAGFNWRWVVILVGLCLAYSFSSKK